MKCLDKTLSNDLYLQTLVWPGFESAMSNRNVMWTTGVILNFPVDISKKVKRNRQNWF